MEEAKARSCDSLPGSTKDTGFTPISPMWSDWKSSVPVVLCRKRLKTDLNIQRNRGCSEKGVSEMWCGCSGKEALSPGKVVTLPSQETQRDLGGGASLLAEEAVSDKPRVDSPNLPEDIHGLGQKG